MEDMARGPDAGIAIDVPKIGTYRGYDLRAPGAFIVALALTRSNMVTLRASRKAR